MPIQNYPRPARRHEQAHQMWMILSAYVALECKGKLKRKGIITYGELASKMGYPVQAGYTLSEPLGMIARFCMSENLPLLNTVVVSLENGEPGTDVIFDPSQSLRKQQKKVKKFDWFSIRPPSLRAIREASSG